MKNNLFPTIRLLVSGAAAAVLLGLGGGAHAEAYVNATVGGELAPGVYGRINIGNAPPPPLLYAEPVIIQRPAVVVPRAPIYMYVPPGHAKNWSKHCARYNACSQPVYFVQERAIDRRRRHIVLKFESSDQQLPNRNLFSFDLKDQQKYFRRRFQEYLSVPAR